MNRIILVGNGFDLAHNLRTSYKDFMNWYWEEWCDKLLKSNNRSEKDRFYRFDIGTTDYQTWEEYKNKRKYTRKDFVNAIKQSPYIYKTSYSQFFDSINKSFELKGWLDIENEYYEHLLRNASKPRRVNEDFEILKDLLLNYLQIAVKESNMIDGIKAIMEAPFRPTEIAIAEREKWKSFVVNRVNLNAEQWEHILGNYDRDITDNMLIELFEYAEKHNEDCIRIINGDDTIDSIPNSLFLPDRILLLNFNYTTTADRYLPQSGAFSTIHIHGELSQPESVIFGYGDEIDEGYEMLKRKNNNECLKHMKTCRYLETVNYRRMEAFMNSSPYQVYIMGHSCGNSDRTLLKSLFEHNNCVSIKPFYYVNEKGEDNYLEIVQNISRSFTDAAIMRDRVVKKPYCEPLPQLVCDNS